MLRRELVGAWRAIDAILEGWTENTRILTEEIQRLAEEIDQSKGTIRRQEAELKDLARQLAVHENHNNPSSKATLFAKKRKKHRRAAKEAAAGGASTATHTGKRGARPSSPGRPPRTGRIRTGRSSASRRAPRSRWWRRTCPPWPTRPGSLTG